MGDVVISQKELDRLDDIFKDEKKMLVVAIGVVLIIVLWIVSRFL